MEQAPGGLLGVSIVGRTQFTSPVIQRSYGEVKGMITESTVHHAPLSSIVSSQRARRPR